MRGAKATANNAIVARQTVALLMEEEFFIIGLAGFQCRMPPMLEETLNESGAEAIRLLPKTDH
jgi:hypothetical protein